MLQKLWDPFIRPLLESIHALRIVEIGVGDGGNTKKILEYIEPLSGRLDAIDTDPMCDIATWTSPCLHFHKGLSLNVLGDLGEYDAVLIDGDHNWYTVYHELLIIEHAAKKMKQFPLVLLHDVGWPCARRDLYYAPENIPDTFRHPYIQKGVMQDSHELSEDATINGTFYNSIYEHAIKNGVLTAVEDFYAQTEEKLRFVNISGWHGFGILASEALMKHYPALKALLDSYEVSVGIEKHIASLEEARIANMHSSNIAWTELEALQGRLHEIETREQDIARAMQESSIQANALAQERTKLKLDENRLHMEKDLVQNQRRTVEIKQLEMEQKKEELFRTKNMLEYEITKARAEQVQAERHIECSRRDREQATIAVRTAREERAITEEKLSNAESNMQSLRAELSRMHHTKSWRYTAWLRSLEPFLSRPHNIRKSILRSLKSLWVLMGEPFPGLIRRIRHRTLGAVLPPATQENTQSRPDPTIRIGVIIPCHNYGRYLHEALESVLRQTLLPTEIVVVDDASTDETALIAAEYADRRVKYVRGEWKSVGAARNAGLHASTADFLVFLDADDLLHPTYLRTCYEILNHNAKVAIAYPNQQYFGDSDLYYSAPETFDWKRFDEQNHMSCVSMVRRTALLQAGGFSHGVMHDGDWVTWRRILRLGWEAMKADTVFYYRVHTSNMTAALQTQQKTYAERAGFLEEPATLCIALSGRAWALPAMILFLEKQLFPHHLIHLVLLDTSQDQAFGDSVQRWLDHCDYASATLLRESVGAKGLADLPRADAIQDELRNACAAIYNRFARLATTGLVFFLEDDIIPPLDAYMRLVSAFTQKAVSVSACYFHRNSKNPVAWDWPAPDAQPEFAKVGTGIGTVGGNGFGCNVVRGEYLRRTVFHAGLPYHNYDHNFYNQAVNHDGYTALIDWDCRCEHRSAPLL